MIAHVFDHDGVAQIRLVGAVFAHRLLIGDTREDRGHRFAIAKLFKEATQHRLDSGKNVVLLNEAHFDIELVELTRRAVGAGILVAETRCDLEVAVKARDHHELLELLRRLG